MKQAYPAIIHEEDGSCWVEFPDLEGCFSAGDTIAEAAYNASEALGLYLCAKLENGSELPKATIAADIQAEDGIVTLVATDPDKYRKNTRAVKKTLSIPEWLNAEAEKRHLNFSSILQQALINALE